MKLETFLTEVCGPKGYHLAELLVVNPYPVPDFFLDVAKALRPKHCVLVVDDGWPPSRIEAVQRVLRRAKVRATIHPVQAPESGGLVHAKLYLFRWQNPTGNRQLRKLYFGSANASPQGFGLHSEVLAELSFTSLSAQVREMVGAYFDSLSSGATETDAVTFATEDGVRIWLPDIHLAAPGAPSFDSWIRAGRLCHRHAPDTSFGKLTVRLLKPLEKTHDEEIFALQGFVRETRREVLQRAYAGTLETTDDNPQWRSKFFTETDCGDWTSNDCFVAQQDGDLVSRGRQVLFQSQGASERTAIVSAIRDGTDVKHEAWIEAFGGALALVATQMNEWGLSPDEYLHMKSARVDLAKYTKKWRSKLHSDRARARIPEFYKRMETGFVFPMVPPLGSDYEAFVCSLCATLLRGTRLLRRRNALAKTIGYVLEVERIADIDDGADLYGTLRQIWADPEQRLQIQQFHVDEVSEDGNEWA